MFRFSTAADCRQIYKLICQLEAATLPYAAFRDVYLEQLKDCRYYSYIYEENCRIAGFLNLRVEKQLHHAAAIAEIMEFIIAADCRGHGVGRRMLELASRQAQELGCCGIEVASSRRRTAAHRFYEQCGMRKSHFKLTLELTASDTK